MNDMTLPFREAHAPAERVSGPGNRRVGIAGAGTLGTGLAIRLLAAGLPVTLFDRERGALDAALAAVRAACAALAPELRARRLALLAATTYLHHVKDCELIVEALDADRAARERLFRGLDQLARPGAILLARDHGWRVEDAARCTRRAGEVLGWRPSATPGDAAWELVRGKDTSSETLAGAAALCRALG